MHPQRIDIALKSKRLLAPGIMELNYVRTDDKPITYVPGQFFSLHFPFENEEKNRSYSTAGRVDNIRENREFCFVIRAVPKGAASQFFFATEPGDSLKMSGPFGALTLPLSDPRRYIFIGTGTGAAPFRTMLPSLLQRMAQNSELEVELILGARSAEAIIYKDEFQATAQQTKNLRLSLCYSQEHPNNSKVNEYPGRVQTQFGRLHANPQTDIVYLCGNPGMVEESAEYFKERDFTPKNLKQEKYKFSTL